MDVKERLKLIQGMCLQLVGTTSRIDKEGIIRNFKAKDQQLSEDIDYVFEILSSVHKLGFTFISINIPSNEQNSLDASLKDYLAPLYSLKSFTRESIATACSMYYCTSQYLNPILNRHWRVGINKSQLPKEDISPMLAKKYDPLKHCKQDHLYYITEKLDGNRCLAMYNVENCNWVFFSRSGKLLKVNFDMKDLPKEYIYDGEILSRSQMYNPGQRNFNTLSGIINSDNDPNKTNLVYNVFDIANVDNHYGLRRIMLAEAFKNNTSNNVILLPVLATSNSEHLCQTVTSLLNDIENRGGEGVMINDGTAKYQHKRTDVLLKVKSTYTMDMRVLDIEEGSGKYEGMVGALYCVAKDGNIEYSCKVGSGLSDSERLAWFDHEELIIGKIVEVAFFSTSQCSSAEGTTRYSLRFPRFKGVRNDKNDTSVD